MANADKRSVVTDALETLGSTIDENAGRDAIHLAVEPVVAAHMLVAGQNVGLVEGQATAHAAKHLGIVDPFLKHPVNAGERFWLVVYPRQITSLRHVWTHPDFPEPDVGACLPMTDVERSIAWIRDYADRIDLHYNALMNGADDWVATHDGKWGGEYLVQGGTLEGVSTSPEFWKHYEVVRGKTLDEGMKENFFSCSC
jgi:hypothetical protein